MVSLRSKCTNTFILTYFDDFLDSLDPVKMHRKINFNVFGRICTKICIIQFRSKLKKLLDVFLILLAKFKFLSNTKSNTLSTQIHFPCEISKAFLIVFSPAIKIGSFFLISYELVLEFIFVEKLLRKKSLISLLNSK